MVEFFALLREDAEREVCAVEITTDYKTLCVNGGEFRKCELPGRRMQVARAARMRKESASKDTPWQQRAFVVAAVRSRRC